VPENQTSYHRSMNDTDTLTQRLARNLDLIRKARQMDVHQFAEQSGISRQLLSLWRRGDRSATVAYVDRAARGLGVEPSALLESDPAEVLRKR
jgi:transcriptional regulator with XRE-family HTH domain